MNNSLLVLDLSIICKDVLAVKLDEKTWKLYAEAYENNEIGLYDFIIDLAKTHKGKTFEEMKKLANEIKPVSGAYKFVEEVKKKGYDIAIITKDYSLLADRFKRILETQYAFGSIPFFYDGKHAGEMEYVMDEKGILNAIDSIKNHYNKIITIADDRAYKVLDKISEIIVYNGKDDIIKNTSYKHVDSSNILDLLKSL